MESSLFTRRAVGTAAIIAVAVTAGVPAATAQAADPRLDQADDHLLKARLFIEASQPGAVSEKKLREWERNVARTLRQIDLAREQLADTKAAVDQL